MPSFWYTVFGLTTILHRFSAIRNFPRSASILSCFQVLWVFGWVTYFLTNRGEWLIYWVKFYILYDHNIGYVRCPRNGHKTRVDEPVWCISARLVLAINCWLFPDGTVLINRIKLINLMKVSSDWTITEIDKKFRWRQWGGLFVSRREYNILCTCYCRYVCLVHLRLVECFTFVNSYLWYIFHVWESLDGCTWKSLQYSFICVFGVMMLKWDMA